MPIANEKGTNIEKIFRDSHPTETPISTTKNTEHSSKYLVIDPSKLKIDQKYRSMVPSISEIQYKTLKESISAEGQIKPIICNSSFVILDGHNRVRACKELGLFVKCEVLEILDESEELKLVLVTNIPTRRLNDYQLVEMVLPLVELEKEAAKKRQINVLKSARDKQASLPPNGGNSPASLISEAERGRTSERIAALLGLKTRQVEKIFQIMRRGSPELKEAVQSGRKEIGTACADLSRNETMDLQVTHRIAKSDEVKSLPQTEIVLKSLDFMNANGKSRLLGQGEADLVIARRVEVVRKDLRSLAAFCKEAVKPGGFVIFTITQQLVDILYRETVGAGIFKRPYWVVSIPSKSSRPPRFLGINSTFELGLVLFKRPVGKHILLDDSRFLPNRSMTDEDRTLEAWKYYIRALTPGDEVNQGVVLDPLCTDFTVLKAAYVTGRKAYGLAYKSRRRYAFLRRELNAVGENTSSGKAVTIATVAPLLVK